MLMQIWLDQSALEIKEFSCFIVWLKILEGWLTAKNKQGNSNLGGTISGLYRIQAAFLQ